MDNSQAAALWESNAQAWTTLARAGLDVYRDALNTPAFFEILPDIHNQTGLDIGCGEGHNTRLLESRGARMFAIDVSPTFIRHASQHQSIHHSIATAHQLPFSSNTFDFATSFMCLRDFPDPHQAICEIHRILRPGGFLQFSITHPCFTTPHRRLLRATNRKAYVLEVGCYFDNIDGRVESWIFSGAPSSQLQFQTPSFHRTLSQWLNSLIKAGLTIEHLAEPHATDEMAAQTPHIQDTQVAGYFLHIRCRNI